MADGLVMKDYIEKIKESHFEDRVREKSLCEELLTYSQKEQNAYGIGFAYTYLLDYYIAMHDTAGCSGVMRRALEFHAAHDFPDLRMQVFNFAGIFYSYIHDDITAFEYFLKSLEMAEKLDDGFMRYRLYNNIAVSFHNKKDTRTALSYYRKAYDYLKYSQLSGVYEQYQLYLLQNIINCSIAQGESAMVDEYAGRLDRFFEDFPELKKDQSVPWQEAILQAYYGRDDEAYRILEEQLNWEGKDPLDATDIIELYPHVFEFLMKRRDQVLAGKVLESMRYYMERESPGAEQEVCAYEIRYCEEFGLEEELQKAYRAYFQVSRKAQTVISENQTRAMTEKIASFETQQKVVRLQRLSYTDELCEIYNRRYYSEQLERMAGSPLVGLLGIIILDIDYFKEYNDFYGHSRGDEVLRQVSACIRGEADDRVIPCRYGGDEFCCICVDLAPDEVEMCLSAILNRVRNLRLSHEKSPVHPYVTVSGGCSVRERASITDPQDLFREADQALYRAKSEGRNRSISYQKYRSSHGHI